MSKSFSFFFSSFFFLSICIASILDADFHFSTSIGAGMSCNYNFFRWKLGSVNWCEARHWSMEKKSQHQEVGDKTVSRHWIYVFFHLFLLFMYSHHSVVSCLLVSKPTEQGMGVRKEKRGRLGKAFMCCVVTVWRACPAAFLNTCISPCTSLSPSASHTARPASPWAQHSASSLRLPWAGSVLLMEPGLEEEQEVKKHGGKGAVLVFGSFGLFSWGLWNCQCASDVHTRDWQLRGKARLSLLSWL